MPNDNAKRTLTPKLRFPEFREGKGWSTERMGKLYSFMRNNAFSRDKLNYESGTVKNVHYGDIHTKFPALFDITKEQVPYVNSTEEIPDADSEDYCVEGDIIFADASEDTNDVGKSIEIVHLNGERLLSGQHTILARRNDDAIIVGFGGHLFRSGKIRSQIQKEAQGTKVYAISSTRLANIVIAYPDDDKEQRKIADCLTSLDEVIAAQGRKVGALKAHKRGLMQQLFPREGESLPRLRFPEFRDAPEWVEKHLEEVAPLQRGFDLPSSELVPGDVPVVYSNGIRSYHKVGMAKGPGLVTGRSGTIGNLHYIEAGNYWPHNTSLWVTTFNGHHPKFVYFLYAAIGLDQFASGSGVPTLNRNDVHAFETRVPSSKLEQQRIADCLSSLDAQIAAESQKLDALKTHKRALMQQLFLTPERD